MIQRVGGADRWETAALLSELVGDADGRVIVAQGAAAEPERGWPDPLAISSLAAAIQVPILLTAADVLPPATAAALARREPSEVVVVGGEASVSAAVVAELADGDTPVRRIAGPNRYATAVAVMDEAIASGADDTTIWLVSGADWPDALASGPVIGRYGHVVLMVAPDDLAGSPATAERLEALAGTAEQIRVVGGPAAISDTVADQVAALLGLPVE